MMERTALPGCFIVSLAEFIYLPFILFSFCFRLLVRVSVPYERYSGRTQWREGREGSRGQIR